MYRIGTEKKKILFFAGHIVNTVSSAFIATMCIPTAWLLYEALLLLSTEHPFCYGMHHLCKVDSKCECQCRDAFKDSSSDNYT